MGEKGEGSGGKGGGNWEWRTPLSTPSLLDSYDILLILITKAKQVLRTKQIHTAILDSCLQFGRFYCI